MGRLNANQTREVPLTVFSRATALNFGRLAGVPVSTAFAQTKPIHHPVNREARYAQQFGRVTAIPLGRLQRANQRELRGVADYGVERVGPISPCDIEPALDEIGYAIWQHRIERHADRFHGYIF